MSAARRSLAVLGVLGAGLAGPGHAQDALGAAQSRAWLGVRAEAAELPGGRAFAVVVTDIYVTGPAHRGGVLPGDLIVAVNGAALASYDDWLTSVSDLEPGQPFRVEVVRGDAASDITIVADRRPLAPFDAARFDSIRARHFRTVDSILLQLAVGGGSGDSVLIGFMSAGDRLRAAEARMETRWRAAVEVRRADTELQREAEEMRLLAEEDFIPPVAGGGGDLRAAAEPVDTTVPALTPFVLGRQVVLGGIHVRDLTAELASFVGVDSGMLVTDVLHMSPAARAGFQAGDVILAVAGEPVGSLAALRTTLALAPLPTTITVVRRGERTELTYPPS